MKFRADFDVSGDLVLPHGTAPLVVKGRECEITFKNASNDERGFAPQLIAVVVADAASMDDAGDALRAMLARYLDILAFCTHSRFKIEQIVRLVEWEPHMKTRRFHSYQVFDARYPPDPEMDPGYGHTVETIANSGPERFVTEALRLFRAGLLDGQQQDQFQRFWLALEVVAEGRKGNRRVAIHCPTCGHGLTCPACAMTPLRRPMARQAIRDLLARLLGPQDGDVTYRKMVSIRDGLMHGRSPQAIAAELEEDFGVVVDRLATLAWHAIMSSMPATVLDTPVQLGHRDGAFAAKQLRVGPVGTFDCDSTSDYPPEDKIPSVAITMETSFRGRSN